MFLFMKLIKYLIKNNTIFSSPLSNYSMIHRDYKEMTLNLFFLSIHLTTVIIRVGRILLNV
jgi:hypothetical protein